MRPEGFVGPWQLENRVHGVLNGNALGCPRAGSCRLIQATQSDQRGMSDVCATCKLTHSPPSSLNYVLSVFLVSILQTPTRGNKTSKFLPPFPLPSVHAHSLPSRNQQIMLLIPLKIKLKPNFSGEEDRLITKSYQCHI